MHTAFPRLPASLRQQVRHNQSATQLDNRSGLRLRLIGIVAVLCGVLAGCAASAERAMSDSAGLSAMSEASVAEPGAPAADAVQPSIIVTGYLALATADVAAAAAQARTIVADLDGRVDEESDELPDPTEPQERTVSLRVRVPAGAFDDAIDQLGTLGAVTSRTVTRTDVTLQVVDTAARIRTLTDAIARLRVLINDADSTADLIAAETALAERQAELDSLTAQSAYLNDQTSLATISILLTWREAGSGWDRGGIWLVGGALIGAAAVAAALLIAHRIRLRRRPVAP